MNVSLKFRTDIENLLGLMKLGAAIKSKKAKRKSCFTSNLFSF